MLWATLRQFTLGVMLSGLVLSVDASELTVKPPFAKGKKFLLSQAFFGYQTHISFVDQYAVDIVMPEGEPVCAAYPGQVLGLFDSNDRSQEASRAAHYVYILHADGSVADYHHLKPDSINLQIGQFIAQGECFAEVGLTGKTTGAHLHFAILKQQAYDPKLLGVPFKFQHADGKVEYPQFLQWLSH